MMIELDGRTLTLQQVVQVAYDNHPVSLSAASRAEMERSHHWVAAAAHGELRTPEGEPLPVYGVNTGYGSLARVQIPEDRIAKLSWNLIRSHAAGVGPDVPSGIVRAMMLLRANALAKGASGCRPEIVTTLCDMLNHNVVPVIPARGSCGSSGDLAPLSHLGLVLFKGPDEAEATSESGEATYQGERMSGADAMAAAGLSRLVPGPKEGLAMNNGAQLTCAYGAVAAYRAARLVQQAEVACAMSWEALRGVTRALHPDVHRLRPYPGAIDCAADLRALLAGSKLTDSIPDKVQDAYSIRCTPQILGAARDGIRYATQQIAIELNSVTDNPVILMDEVEQLNKAFSAGLFHGEALGLACDHLKLSLIELAAVSERRIYRLTTGNLSARLPPLLAEGSGLNLGLMMPQVTAAGLVGQCRQLAYPASADSIPTCEDQEDHVAMSTTAARRALDVLELAEQVVAIEILCASMALWVRRSELPELEPSPATCAALEWVETTLGCSSPGAAPADQLTTLLAALSGPGLLGAVRSTGVELTEVVP